MKLQNIFQHSEALPLKLLLLNVTKKCKTIERFHEINVGATWNFNSECDRAENFDIDLKM